MPTGLKRIYGKGDLHFVTFSCYRRLSLLNTTRARNLFVKELERVRDHMHFRLIGYVVMPNHVHLLMSEPLRSTPSAAIHRLKLSFSRRVRKRRRLAGEGQLQLSFAERSAEPRAFWQARFYDFNVYSNGKKKEKLNYMHANPVKNGLVKHPKDWPWSSWSFYWKDESGLIRLDAQ